MTLTTTPHTLAPEVWAGDAVDGRADLYGLGVILYHALTGGYPFDAEEPGAFAELHLAEPVPRPSLRAATVGGATEMVLLRALAKSPAARHESGAELAAALRDALTEDGLLAGARRRPAPADAPAQDTPAASSPLPFREDAIEATTAALERFEATLNEKERAALQALMERARVADAITVGGVVDLTRQVFGPPAALLALEDTGAAHALADGPLTAEAVAATCGAPTVTIGRILEVLAAAGLLGRDEADRFELPMPLATLYRSYRRVGATARPVRDHFDNWMHLPHWAASREPNFYSDTSDGNVYQRVVGVLGTLYEGAARQLAVALAEAGCVPPGARVLDVGAGSGVWSIALAVRDPAIQISAVDRPSVLEMTRVYAEASGVGGRLEELAGDWQDVPLPAGGFDLAILANICHLEEPEDNRFMVRRLFGALRPGGRVVIVDTMPERRRDASLSALLQGLDIAQRTPGGGINDRETYARWMEDAGFEVETFVPLRDPTGRLRALVGRRPG
jgi:2-polyprenyl-3-methyl-5-hydroxy-6-metoxy-1,4-benzoquinol methylase